MRFRALRAYWETSGEPCGPGHPDSDTKIGNKLETSVALI